jgi:ABC-type transporter Mla subunit MlaD
MELIIPTRATNRPIPGGFVPDDILSFLRDGEAEIDRTFAEVGQRFGAGLAMFDGLKGRLRAVAEEIGHPEMAEARDALAGLSRDILSLQDRLGEEKAALEALKDHSEAAGRLLGDLWSSMRLVGIVTQNLRIERASIQDPARDLEAFAEEVQACSRRAREVIDGCTRSHRAIATLIEAALKAQSTFDGEMGASLRQIATQIDQRLRELGQRQAATAGVVDDMAAHSGRVIMATGEAVMALQSGDNIRQRIAHSITALGIDDGGAEGLRPVLMALQGAQLRATAALLDEDCGRISETLALLGDETGRLTRAVEVFVGAGDAGASSSLIADLETGLGAASGILGHCDRARGRVDHVMAELITFLEGFETAVAELRRTVLDIVFLGTNAGLKAAHLGESGRGLVVIAKELKSGADLVERQARELAPTFGRMLAASTELRQRAVDSSRISTFDITVQGSLGRIRRVGERLGDLLRGLHDDAGRFSGDIDDARRAFMATAARSHGIDDVAAQLEAMAEDAQGDDEADAAAIAIALAEKVWPLYTMKAEREIHSAALAALGIDGGQPAPPASIAAGGGSPAASDFDAFETFDDFTDFAA